VKTISWAKGYALIVKILAALFFLSLPITSFPFFPSGLGGRTLVRPLAVYPLIFLVLLVTLPRLFTRPLPRTFLPLFAFVVAAMISSAVALSNDQEVLRGVTLADRFARNLVTIGLGLAFYLTITLLHQNWEDLRFTLRWLYAGFAVAMAWGSLQIIYVLHFMPWYFKLLNAAQKFVSSRKLFTTRISGLTYEPKWFAEQICFLLIPWLLSSVLTRRTVFPWRYRWITIELGLLIWASGVMVFTFSRTGLLILAAMIFLGYLIFRASERTPAKAKSIMPAPLAPQSPDEIESPAGPAELTETDENGIPVLLKVFTTTQTPTLETPPVKPWRQRPLIRVLEAALIIVVFISAVYVVGSRNPYFSRLWRYYTEAKQRNKTYLEFIAFEQRFVYWETAFNIYRDHPLLGVGLGNYAFYFANNLPNRPWNEQAEIVRQLTPGEGRDRLITPKNLLARLIAETGLLGLGLFITFILALIGCTLYLWFSNRAEDRFWGLSGILALVVFAFVVFSFDSFALPNMWVVFGIVTAAAHLKDPVPTLV
jgi:hypothetical protein